MGAFLFCTVHTYQQQEYVYDKQKKQDCKKCVHYGIGGYIIEITISIITT
ncbi:hypothetical protein MTsPCn9_00420 [Croceitalea sp. MTPC9]|nr:hypothetical protein MTsPCn6_08290 [Croceitalea sp. MTPC6]GMN15106.1 hypothetical protein MTsPCn9_00420 [Croceitalea sp. MTPC9]